MAEKGLSHEEILKILKDAAEKKEAVQTDDEPILSPEARKRQEESDKKNNPGLIKKGGLTIGE